MHRASIPRLASLLLGTALWVAGPAAAQTVSASLRGTVEDEGGQPIAGATVRAVDPATGFSRTAATDDGGAYRILLLRPAVYDVTAEMKGFAVGRRGIDLGLGASRVLDFELQMAISERVEVPARPPLFDPSTTSLGTRIDEETIQSLPLNGRMFTDLALLNSSVRPAAPGIFFGEHSSILTLNGSGGRSNSYLVDGSDNNDFVFGSRNNAFFSADVIQEFQVLADGYSAEFGRASGGVLNIITRSGTNQFSGSAFYQFTNDAYNGVGGVADDFSSAGLDRTGLDRQQFGFSVSGPFVKDRAFYLAAYEGGRQDDVVGYTGIDGDGRVGGRFPTTTDGDRFFLRTDFHLDSVNYLAVRLNYSDETVTGLNVLGRNTPEVGSSLAEEDLQAAVSLRSIFSPTLFNEVRVQWSTSDGLQTANSSIAGVERPGGNFGGNDLNQRDVQERQFQFVDNVTLVRGDHSLKFGLDVSRVEVNVSSRFNPLGVFQYGTDEPFEGGDTGLGAKVFCDPGPNPGDPLDCSDVGIGEIDVDDDGDGIIDESADFDTYPVVYRLIEGRPSAAFHDTALGFFVQDEWRAREGLNLNFGLRYDLESFELGDEFAIDSAIPNGGAERDTDNLAPRFSFTWLPTEEGRFLLRGGIGLFYDKVVLGFPAISAITSEQLIRLGFFQGLGIPCTETAFDVIAIDEFKAACGLLDINAERVTLRFSTGDTLDTPYTVQWNLGFERAVSRNLVFGMNYVHARGYHVPLYRDVNPIIGEDPDTDGLPLHLDPNVGSIAAIETMGNTWYDGLTLQLQRRSGRFRFLASYTYSRSFDESSDPLKGGIFLPPDSGDISGERARADNDQRHRLVWSGTWDTPWWGIRLAPVVVYASGAPFNVTTGIDDNSVTLDLDTRNGDPLPDGFTQERPPGVPRNSGASTPIEAINAARAEQGLEPFDGRLEEPEFFQVDLRLSREFSTGGGSSVEGYLLVFNLFDRENLGFVDGAVNSPTFGEPLAVVGPPRIIEMGARFGF